MRQGTSNIAFISTFPPTQCGIATYSTDIIQAIQSLNPLAEIKKIELSLDFKSQSANEYVIEEDNAKEFSKVAEYINSSNVDIVDLQHEFKIFGKPDGGNVLILLDKIKKPICTTLHTVSPYLNERREKIFMDIIKRSDLLYVFSSEAKKYIVEKYKISNEKIIVVPHGVPSINFKAPRHIQKGQQSSSIIFISAGHMREAKGYELAIAALHLLKDEIPAFHYIILGADHPQNGSSHLYRGSLFKIINELGMSQRVTFIDKYLTQKDLIDYIQLADICLIPYNRMEQSSSGVLALMVACGRPVVSTPFQFAKSYIKEASGVLSNSSNSHDFAAGILSILNKKDLWQGISRYNYAIGQSWNWKKVAFKYMLGYERLISHKKIHLNGSDG